MTRLIRCEACDQEIDLDDEAIAIVRTPEGTFHSGGCPTVEVRHGR